MESFRNFAYVSSYLHLKSFAWKRDYVISQKLQMPQTWSRSFWKALVEFDKCKLTASTRPFFVKSRWVLNNFWHLICYNSYYILRKIAIYFRSLTLLFENTAKTISIGPLITKKQPFKKLKTLSVLARFILKIKKADIFNFLSVNYFGKRFLYLKIWNVRFNYCGNYGPSNLLFCFTGHNLITNKGKQL